MRYLTPLLICITLILPAFSKAENEISITMPQQVLAEAVSATLPLSYAAKSKTLKGRLEILSIDELELLDQKISGRLHLAGRDLKVVTELAGHAINFNVGEIELDFHTIGKIRFDPAKQTLYIRPMVDKVHTSKDGGGGDIGVAIIALFDDRELPIRLDNLAPIIAKAGNKQLTIDSRITDITSTPGKLHVSLRPNITAKGR